MSLFLLLLIPVAIGLAGLLFTKGRVNIIEFAVSEGVVLVVVIVGYLVAMSCRTADVEIWNGVVAGKSKSTEHCCHPYCCQTCESCSTDSKGNRSCHSYCCRTCYWHDHDVRWDAWSSNSERL